MCLMVYLATDRERPLVPWVEERPAFHVSRGGNEVERVRPQLHKARIYVVGADTGCGCHFRQEGGVLAARYAPEQLDPGAREATRECHRRLHAYVAACLEDEESVELFSCWNGDEQSDSAAPRTLTLADLADEQFHFLEGQRIVVVRGGEAREARATR